jgi:membrane protein YqaA with SNARE-associated domain
MTATLAAWGPWGVLALAFIDSGGIPISVGMDSMLILMGIKAPETAWYGAAMAVLGSMGGNLMLFLAARGGGRRLAAEQSEPGRGGKFRDWFKRYGLATVFIPALSPIPLPLKVFVVTAGVLHVPLRSFLGVVLAARVIRYFGEVYLGMRLGQDSFGFLHHHAWTIAGAALVLLALLFLAMRWKKTGD